MVLIETLGAAAISGIAVPVFQSFWGGAGKVLGIFGKALDEKTRQIIFAASQKYVKNYQRRHGILKVYWVILQAHLTMQRSSSPCLSPNLASN